MTDNIFSPPPPPPHTPHPIFLTWRNRKNQNEYISLLRWEGLKVCFVISEIQRIAHVFFALAVKTSRGMHLYV